MTIMAQNMAQNKRLGSLLSLLATVLVVSLIFYSFDDTNEPLSSSTLRYVGETANELTYIDPRRLDLKDPKLVVPAPKTNDPKSVVPAPKAKDPKSVVPQEAKSLKGSVKVIEPVHVIYAADESAAEGVEASVRSLLHHASEKLVIHYVGPAPLPSFPDIDFIPLESLDEKSLQRFMNPTLTENVGTNLNSRANYVRFIMADILPDVSKIMWIDADTIVKCDVVSMIRSVLTTNEHVIAAVHRQRKPAGLAKGFKTKIRFSFNAGVFVADLDRWRDQGITDKIAAWALRNQEEHIYGLGSQPPMALTIGENFEPLNKIWNRDGLGWKKNGQYSHDSCVLHWSGQNKHWLKNGYHKDLAVIE